MTKYAVVIRKDPEGGFWAEVPALPGCYSQGETSEEVMENVREAIAGVLEVMREEGRQPESDIQVVDVAVEILSIPVHRNRTLKSGLARRIARDAGIAP